MACLILGAGALGRLWAACLPPGASAFVPRPGPRPTPCHFEFVPIDGTPRNVLVPWQPLPIPATLVPDALLVTTKAQHTLSALEAIIDQVPRSAPIVLFQNGLGSQDAVVKAFSDRAIVAASTTEGANRPTPTSLIHAGRGSTWIGGLNAAGQQALPSVTAVLRTTGLDIRPDAEIHQRLWQKLVINAGINPFTALLDCVNGDILTHPFYLEHIDAVCQELANLMTREGLKTDATELRMQVETIARSTANNTSSMRSDVQHGRLTEIDYINGYIVSRSTALNLPAPVNRMLTDRVKSITTQLQ